MVDLADEQNDNAPSNDGDAGADARAKQPANPPAAPSSSSSAARQAQWRSSKSFKPSSTSSVNKLRSYAPHSSSSIPCVVHTPRRRDVLRGSASWSTTTSTKLRNCKRPAKNSSLRPTYFKLCPSHRRLRAATCAVRHRSSSSKLPCSRPRVLHLECARRPRSRPAGLRTRTASFPRTRHQHGEAG